MTLLSYAGLQSAARKRREVGQRTVAWAGTIVSTADGQVTNEVSLEKWTKAKKHIEWLKSQLNSLQGIRHK